MIAITFDIDWAPVVVVEDTLNLLDQAGVQATLFATHASPILQAVTAHEMAVHPNFCDAADDAIELDRLLDQYPSAGGVRTHGYHQNSRILDLFVQRGLRYDSSILMFGDRQIRPFRYWNGLIRLPVFWEDDINCLVSGAWDPNELDLEQAGSLHIFDFHPIHVFLNTEHMARYEAAKPHYQDASRLQEFRNPEMSHCGTRVFLKRLLTLIEHGSSQCLIDIAKAIRAQP